MAKTEQGGFVVHVVTATTDGSGAATVYTDEPVFGVIESLAYVKTDFADGVDFTITAETTGTSLWTDLNVNASEVVFPTAVQSLNTDGSALATHRQIALAGERVKFVIASGGATKTGTFRLVVRRS